MNVADPDRRCKSGLAHCQHVFNGFREWLLFAIDAVQQDRVGYESKSLNASLGRTHEVVIRTIATPFVFAIGANVEGDSDLRHDNDGLATSFPSPNRFTDEALVVAELRCLWRVNVGGVDEGDALGERVVEYGNRVIPWHQLDGLAKRFGEQHCPNADCWHWLVGELGE